jgi:hypothetical protein
LTLRQQSLKDRTRDAAQCARFILGRGAGRNSFERRQSRGDIAHFIAIKRHRDAHRRKQKLPRNECIATPREPPLVYRAYDL